MGCTMPGLVLAVLMACFFGCTHLHGPVLGGSHCHTPAWSSAQRFTHLRGPVLACAAQQRLDLILIEAREAAERKHL
eukprot:1146914-Pelagomonas_calceolata.AAC.29